MVSSITDCDANGACLPATSFQYSTRNAAANTFNAPGSGEWVGGPTGITFKSPETLYGTKSNQLQKLVLQDELDILDPAKHAPSHEETAIAYRRLISNFEQARAYDLVEDCTIGEFEMKRRDSSRFPFATVLGSFYERFPLLRHWVGEQLSVVRFYRLASVYGTSYYRALAVLGFLLIGFGVLFSTVVAIKPMNINAISICSQSSARGALCAGLTHAVEVAALQKDLLYVPVSSSGRMTEVLEQVLIAGQVALLLFALSRRFRR
jgi:hypothetical protein